MFITLTKTHSLYFRTIISMMMSIDLKKQQRKRREIERERARREEIERWKSNIHIHKYTNIYTHSIYEFGVAALYILVLQKENLHIIYTYVCIQRCIISSSPPHHKNLHHNNLHACSILYALSYNKNCMHFIDIYIIYIIYFKSNHAVWSYAKCKYI